MRTVNAVQVIAGVADKCGLDADNLSGSDSDIIRRAISRMLADCYDKEFWPDLMRVEKRFFRALYTPGTTYSAPTTTSVSEVYFAHTQGRGYYQALRAAPLTVSSITRSGTTATVTTSANHLLATGEQVSITGADQTDYNITATITVTGATTFTYTVANSPSTPATGTLRCTPDPTDANGTVNKTYWAASATSYTGDTWSSTETNVEGDVRYWHGTDRFYQYHNPTSSSGNQPTNTTYWAVLTDFDRYVAWAQSGETDLTGASILAVWSENPRTTTQGYELSHSLTNNGIQVHEAANQCWVEYRQKPPILKGENFDADVTYASGDQVYYTSSTAPGNFYDANATTTAGQDPEDTPAKWDIVNIPYIFERILVQAGYAEWLRAEGQADKAAAEQALAYDMLGDQQEQLIGAQQQRKRTVVLTR